jgi:hypothetical protein
MLRWLWNRLWRAIFQEAVEPATESTTSALSDQASLAPITADPVTPPSGTSIDTTTATAVTSETRAPDPVTPPNVRLESYHLRSTYQQRQSSRFFPRRLLVHLLSLALLTLLPTP